MSTEKLNVLLVDDDEDDFLITRDVLAEVASQEYELDWVSTYEDAIAAIRLNKYDVFLIDYRLGEYSGLDLLKEAVTIGSKEPMILLTGQGDREIDIEAMRTGAADYLSKDKIDADVLERAIRYAIERKRAEQEREKLISQLTDAMAKTLDQMLPICAACKSIRDSDGAWNILENYISEHSEAEFTHSLCPKCLTELYPDHDFSASNESKRS